MMAEQQSAVTMDPGSQRLFVLAALVFIASIGATIAWCGSMSAMAGMPMPGDWTMSMAWMRMPGQTWPAAAASFIGMWIVMMVAMMLPSLMPMLWRYRRQIDPVGVSHLDRLTLWVAGGYFAVWIAFGVAAYPIGVGFSALAMQSVELSRTIPLLTGIVTLFVGALQFTGWKTRQLACCRRAHLTPSNRQPIARAAWRHGAQLGLHCSRCCGGLMTLLLVIGVMDLRAMAVLTAAITAERVLPAAAQFARITGIILLTTGAWMLISSADAQPDHAHRERAESIDPRTEPGAR